MWRKKTNLFFIQIIILFSSVLSFGSTNPTRLDLKEALKRSFDYSKTLKIVQSSLNQNVDNYQKAKSALFPTINFTGSTYAQQNNGGSLYSGTATAAGSQSYSAAVSLTQPLYAGGALTSGMDYYQSQVDAAKANLFNTKQTVAFQTVSAFFNLLQAQQLYNAAIENRDILKTYLEVTTTYTRIGRNRQIDKIQATVNYSLSLSDTDLATNNLAVSTAALKTLMGDESGTTYEVVDPGTGDNSYQIPSFDKAFQMAMQQNPAVQLALLQETAVVAQEGIDVSLDMPTLNLVGSTGYTSTDPSNWFVPSAQGSRAGLVLTVPLFSGLSSFHKKDAYQEEIYQAKRTQESTRDSLRVQVVTGIENVKTFKRELDMAQESAKEAKRGLEIANSGFKKGIVSNVDVTNMQTTNYSAEKLQVSSEVGFLQNVLALRQTIGTDLEKTYTQGEINP